MHVSMQWGRVSRPPTRYCYPRLCPQSLFSLSSQETKEIKERLEFLGNGAKKDPLVNGELRAQRGTRDRWVPQGILVSTSMPLSQ